MRSLLGGAAGFAVAIGILSGDNAFAGPPTWRAMVITLGLMVLGVIAGEQGEKK